MNLPDKVDSSSYRQTDLRGLLCPLPTVKTALAIETLNVGEIIDIIADDPTTKKELPGWCREQGHKVITVKDEKSCFCVRIKKGK